MATDAEWERICRAAACGMDRSRCLVHRAPMPDGLPDEALRRALREMPVPSLLAEKRLRLTDPGAANRWKQVSDGERPGTGPPERGPGQGGSRRRVSGASAACIASRTSRR